MIMPLSSPCRYEPFSVMWGAGLRWRNYPRTYLKAHHLHTGPTYQVPWPRRDALTTICPLDLLLVGSYVLFFGAEMTKAPYDHFITFFPISLGFPLWLPLSFTFLMPSFLLKSWGEILLVRKENLLHDSIFGDRGAIFYVFTNHGWGIDLQT